MIKRERSKQSIIYEQVRPPKKNREEDVADLQLLVNNIGRNLQHADYILRMPELNFSSFSRAFISVAYLGDNKSGIGYLLALWEDRLLLGTCNLRQNFLFNFSADGLPLSGKTTG